MLSMHKNLSILAGLAGVLFLSDGLAQALEDIVVTAERREADLQEVPLAVSAFGMQQIDNLQIKEAMDLQRYVPSLNMFNNIVSPTNLSPSLRGGLQQDASVVTAESPFGIYVDDIYLGRLNGNNVKLNDIERVEVLRGPQGTLYGRNTAYGAIKFVTRTPGEDGWFDAQLGAGNNDQYVVGASVGTPLGDSWAGSLTAQYRHVEGRFFNIAQQTEVDKQESVAVRGKLRFMGAEKFDAVLSVSYLDSETDSLQLVNAITPNKPSNCSGFPSGMCGPGQISQFSQSDMVFPNGTFTTNTPWGQLQPPPLKDRPQGFTEQTIVGLTLTYDFTDRFSIKSITGYVGTDDGWHTDLKGDPVGFIGAMETTVDQWSQEIQFLGSIGDRLQYIFGGYFLNEESDQIFAWNFLGPLSQYTLKPETDSIAVFANFDFNITEQLKLTAGVRWSEDDKTLATTWRSFPGNFFGLPVQDVAPDFEGKWDEWTPRLSIDYSFETAGAMDSMLLYGYVSRGFKGGGFSGIAITSPTSFDVYGPETNWTYEGGLKADWWDSRLRTNLAYFFMDIEDIQQNSTVDLGGGAFSFPVQNSGDSEIQGLEFEILAAPIDNLNIFFIGSLLDGEYKNLDPGSSAGRAEMFFGVPVETPQTPDYTFSLGFDYTIDVGGFVDTVAFGMDFYKIDEYLTAATNDFRNEGWDSLNGFISITLGEKWEIKAVGKNLTDEENITSGSRGLGGFIFQAPREYMIEARYRTGF